MNTKHTTAPWTVVPGHGYKIKEWGGNAKEDAANIALIAAAPELLEALETLITVITSNCLNPSNDECNAMVYAAQKAIAKAKGESK